jgi:hypothetical protein
MFEISKICRSYCFRSLCSLKNVSSLSFALGAILLSGCSKDSAYDGLTDSDGIDLTVQVAKGLTIPFGSSSPIFLTELMDTAAVNQLKADAEGQFYLEIDGTLSESTFFVEETPVSFFPELKKLSLSFVIEQSSLPQEVKQLLPSLNEGDDLSCFPDLIITIFRKDISLAGNASFDIHREDIDPALLSVSAAWPQEPVMVDVSINLNRLPAQRKNLQAKNFRLILPKYVVMQHESAPGEFQLQDVIMNDAIAEEFEWSETFVATALDFARDDQGELIVDNGTVDRRGKMDVIGDVYITEYQCKGSDLYIQLDENGNKIVAMKKPVEIEFTPVVKVPDLMLSHVIGKFSPNITDTETCVNIDLSEKMSFLKENTTSIDLKDPHFVLDIMGNCTIGLLADFLLTASNDKVVAFEDVLLCNGEAPQHVVLDVNAVATGYDLHNFLSPVPDSVIVRTKPFVDSSNDYTFHLGDSVKVSGEYQVIIPCDFNEISIVYDQRIANLLGSDPESITDKVPSIKDAQLTLTAINAIPLDLHLAVFATNRYTGLVEPNLVDCDINQVIKAGSVDNPMNTAISATLNIPNTDLIGDLIIHFTGTGADCVFNAKQYIQIDDAKISLSQGLNVNFN